MSGIGAGAVPSGADLAIALRRGAVVPDPVEAKGMRKASMGAVGACALLLATGCATSGRVEKLEGRVDALEGRVGQLEKRFDDVEKRAAAAESTAQRAAQDAQAAAQRADDAARRADAMFKKSVTK
jgi:outer membrane murein-binding lipoprotein Lpp